MEQIITAKLKLRTTPEQFNALRQTQLAYRDALNYISTYAFEHSKSSNEKRLHQGTYYDARAKFHLPSEMTNNAIRQVASAYKSLWTRFNKNAEHRHKKITKKLYKGLNKPPKFISPTITYNYKYDYSFKPNQQVSIKTLGKRIILPYQGFSKHVALIKQGATIKAGRLWYDRQHRCYYLLVALAINIAPTAPENYREIVGVDVGQRYLATVASFHQQRFFSGKVVRVQADRYARRQKKLQRKGTRAAVRRLRLLHGRERRFKLDTNHTIAKSIITEHSHAVIGLEHLTDIRERVKRPKVRRKGTKIFPLTPKQRRANLHHTSWSFAQLQQILAYKAKLAGSLVIKVDADYTSLTCPMCGYCNTENRPAKGLLFICHNPRCIYRQLTQRPYTLHADLVGSRNIAMRTFLTWQDWMRTGILSVCPDVSSNEAKTTRLKRYAGMRWSSDTSLRFPQSVSH